MVERLRTINLRFGRLSEDGVTVNQVPNIQLRGLAVVLPITYIGNGYFHIELTIPARPVPGEYHLIQAIATAKMLPDYQGPDPAMTNSPVRERYCVTIVSSLPPKSPPSPQPGG